MTAIAIKPFDYRKLFILIFAALLIFGLGAIFSSVFMNGPSVPLNPCKTCGSACGCPRMSGSIRCGCPQ